MTRLLAVVLHCADVYAMADFWSSATGFTVDPVDATKLATRTLGEHESVRLAHPTGALELWLAPAEELESPAGRGHLDLELTAAEVEALLTLGASIIARRRWLVMADPEGNRFCAHVLVSDVAGDS